MKEMIRNLEKYEREEDSFVFYGGVGTLSVRFISQTIIHFDYQFAHSVISNAKKTASAFMSDDVLCENVAVKVSENEKEWILRAGSSEVRIERHNACVSVYHEGKLVHGGSLGNSDTVVPSSQVRYFQEQGDEVGYARFNFPLEKDDEFYGLGDKSGRPNRRGRRFAMFNRDSLGYDAESSDPLYKSIPFVIKMNPHTGVQCGLFIDATLISSVDLGRESVFYFDWEIKGGPYSYYVLQGDEYKDILREYYRLTGFPVLPPLFSFGFFGSSMNYVEADDAADRILQFFDKIEKNDILCEGMYVSSGYLKADNGKRYAFFWNKRKFPDYGKYLSHLSSRGYNLCMNIKPGILKSHPWYEELAQKGYFVKDKNGTPYVEFFWGGPASLIDFTNPDACAWWKSQLKDKYLDHGCTGIWNDNNEFEIEDPEVPVYAIRQIMPVLMCRVAYQAFEESDSHHRHWIYTRSGYSGIQRYARTWSGDNVSDWKTLKNNQYMGIGFGLSGMPYYGHDLGGFFGKEPSEELLFRSCQSGVFQPRFVIHSWRENGEPTEPWTYPSSFSAIRSLIREHYRFMPYIYSCAFQASLEGKPMDRALHLEYPDDPNLSDDLSFSQFGDSLIKAPVLEEGETSLSLRLPENTTWYEGQSGKKVESGKELIYQNGIGDPLLWFAKAGSVIATNPNPGKLKGAFQETLFLAYPAIKGSGKSTYYEDDGETVLSEGKYNRWKIMVSSDKVIFMLERKGFVGKGRRFRVGDHSFDPDTLQEKEAYVVEMK